VSPGRWSAAAFGLSLLAFIGLFAFAGVTVDRCYMDQGPIVERCETTQLTAWFVLAGFAVLSFLAGAGLAVVATVRGHLRRGRV
jgi:hypothetical protein